MQTLNELKSTLQNLSKNNISLKSINWVKIDPAQQLPTSGSCVLKAGTVPEVQSQPGVNPWLYYTAENGQRLSKTALVGASHFAKSDTPCSFRDLQSRTEYKGLGLDRAWTATAVDVNGVSVVIPVPAVDLEIQFSNLGTVYVPAKFNGSDIESFRQKDNYAGLTIKASSKK